MLCVNDSRSVNGVSEKRLNAGAICVKNGWKNQSDFLHRGTPLILQVTLK